VCGETIAGIAEITPATACLAVAGLSNVKTKFFTMENRSNKNADEMSGEIEIRK
jgi:hypothetical protein